MNFLIRIGVPEMLALWENSKMKIENPPELALWGVFDWSMTVYLYRFAYVYYTSPRAI